MAESPADLFAPRVRKSFQQDEPRMKARFKYISLFIGLLIPMAGLSQGEWNNWYFGGQAGVTFNSLPPQPLLDGQMYANRACAVVSDSLGNLLFYTDGTSVWDRTHSIMPNGTGLFCDNSAQGVQVVKYIANDSLYYIFTKNCTGWPPPLANEGLHYSVLNMKLNYGYGDIMTGQKNITLLGMSNWPLLMTTTRHHNNQDAWLIIRNTIADNHYYAYLITSAGIQLPPVISNSPVGYIDPATNIGYMRVSPDGTKLIFPDLSLLEYCLFNSTTGLITPLFHCQGDGNGPDDGWGYLEFSIDSKYLYRSGGDWYNAKIYQYDATIEDSVLFKQSEIQIGQSTAGVHLQMGPDWKIYGDQSMQNYLCVINNPTVPGIGCHFQTDAVSLTRTCYHVLPQFLQRYYVYIHHDDTLCAGRSIAFTSSIWPTADSAHWDFGDPASGSSDFSIIPNPFHIYSNPGTYTVELFVKHIDHRTDTTWQTITIMAGPQVNLGPDRTICLGDSVTFDAGACGGCTYQWKNLNNGLIVATTQTYKTGLAGTYTVGVSSPNICLGRDTVVLYTTPVPSVMNSPLSKTICTQQSTDIMLMPNVSGTIFHWTATLTSGSITGYSADSGTVINQVLVNSLATPGVVTYHITPIVGSCSGQTVDFSVTVNPLLPVSVSISASTNPVCSGTSVTFTANPIYGGTSPSYQWKVNGVNAGSTSSIFSYTPVNNDVVTCILTSSLTTCITNNPATSNALTMTVTPLLPVSVNILASANPFCSGSSVTFTATPVNGGSSPFYQWKVNGANAGTNSSTYTYNPLNGDQVSCVLTSNAICTQNNPATSNMITMVVNTSLPAGISITAVPNPFCPGATVTYNAVPVNGGSAPVYQWKVNGTNQGTNSSTFSFAPQAGDSIRCVLTSNPSCVTGSPASSNTILMSSLPAPLVSFALCFDSITTLNAAPFHLKGGVPPGGTYSGPGVNSSADSFTPSIAGTGIKVITYSYTNFLSCSSSKTRTITVQTTPSFVCGQTLTDIRDGKVYPTVQIGSQCWMQKNLNYGISLQGATEQTDNCTNEKYCYNDDAANCSTYGGLYQWDEVMAYTSAPGSQGLCPPGWHVPTQSEWNTLFIFYQNQALAGKPLQDSIISLGFKARESGVNYSNSIWKFHGFATLFWTSTPSGAIKAVSHGMNLQNFSVSDYYSNRSNAFAVRCLRD